LVVQPAGCANLDVRISSALESNPKPRKSRLTELSTDVEAFDKTLTEAVNKSLKAAA
jgi:hypothetical protein